MTVKSIKQWFEQAKPEPTAKDAAVQIGCHYEEVTEMAEVLSDTYLVNEVKYIADAYKSKRESFLEGISALEKEERIALLDSLCDQIVTAVGVAHMLGMDIESALAEVNRSNWSKFVDGMPVLDANGKIAKPETYSPPDLEKYI